MAQNTPSYIISRNGIFYFQIRIPQKFRASADEAPKFLRRSTKTGNRREALRIAHKWMAKLMDDKKEPNIKKWLEERDEDDNSEYQFLYSLGKNIFSKLALIDANDEAQKDAFFLSLTPQEFNALSTYTENANAEDQKFLKLQSRTDHLNGLSNNSSTILPHPAISSTTSISLSRVLELYLEYNSKKAKIWIPKTKNKVIFHINLMIELVGNPDAIMLTAEMLRDQYAQNISKLPKNRQLKKYMNGNSPKSIHEILEIAGNTKDKTIGQTTISDHIASVISFLKWAQKQRYVQQHIHDVITAFTKLNNNKKEDKEVFSTEDIKKLFENERLQKGEFFKKPFRHWGLLLGLYTGARLDEIS